MIDKIIIAHYPESDWGSDLVCFHLPNATTDRMLIDALDYPSCTFTPKDYDTLQDYADALFTYVAQSFGGTWNYVAQVGTVDIEYD